MMNDYIMISTFYSMNNLTPSLEWYHEHHFITDEQYEQIKSSKDENGVNKDTEQQNNNEGQG